MFPILDSRHANPMIPILDTHDAISLAHVDAQAATGLRKIAAAAGDVTPAGPAADLPDRAFCLIYDRPSGRERRYPVDSAAHTRLAMAEFETFGQHVHPSQTARTAGANLLLAAERFGLKVPEALESFHDPCVTTNLAPPPEAPATKTARAEGPFALTVDGKGRYPLTTPAQVKTACQYFVRHLQELPPRHRHPFAHRTAEQALKLGVAVSRQIQSYSVHAYSPWLKHAMVSRVAAARSPEHRDALLTLCRRKTALDPDAFASQLYRIDRKHGCADYGRQRADPWTAVFCGARHSASDAGSPDAGSPDTGAPDTDSAKLATRAVWKLAASGQLSRVLGAAQAHDFLDDPETTAARLDPVAVAAIESLSP